MHGVRDSSHSIYRPFSLLPHDKRNQSIDAAAAEPFEDLGAHAKSFHSPEGEKVLSCPLHKVLLTSATESVNTQSSRTAVALVHASVLLALTRA